MSLDVLRAKVALRDRAPTDVLDLALRFVVVEGRAYARLAAVTLLPLAALTIALGHIVGWVTAWIVCAVLSVAVEASFAVLASRLVFEDEPRTIDVLRRSAAAAPTVIAVRLGRLVAIAVGALLFVVGGVWMATSLVFAGEVVLLEHSPARAAFARSQRLALSAVPEALFGAVVIGLLRAGAIVLADIAGRAVLGELLQFTPPPPLWRTGGGTLAVLGFLVPLPWFTTARFFLYLNVRTRVEGWDIQTRFHAIAARMTALAFAGVILLGAATAHATTAAEPDELDARARAAMAEGGYSFCSAPNQPLRPSGQRICPLAREIEDCAALVAACDAATEPSRPWLTELMGVLAPLARGVLYALVLAVAAVLALPVLRGLRGWARRRRARLDAPAAPAHAELRAPPAPPDAEEPAELLARADAEHAAGHAERALGLYLAAGLAALARRGAIRLARQATNGEYVRSCTDPGAQAELRDLVREAERALFGDGGATPEGVGRARTRALALVSAIAIALVLPLAGCATQPPAGDPVGDGLPREVLARSGFSVKPLEGSLARLPLPEDPESAPVVVVDGERVALEAEARAHLLTWVEHGGTLLLFGSGSGLGPAATPATAATRDLHVVPDVEGARVARPETLAWADADPVATLDDGGAYAVRRVVGRGAIVAVANDDLFTNAGVLHRHNAAALVAITRAAGRARQELQIALPADGVTPPSNPVEALVATGLGAAIAHALAASVLLFLAAGVRRTRPRSERGASRRALLEHVAAIGALYARAGAASHVLAAYRRFADLRRRGEALPETPQDASRDGDELRQIEVLRRLLVAQRPSATTASGTPRAPDR
jgi:hypothetical protein